MYVDAMINRQPSQRKAFEGQIVDGATEYRLSAGKLAESRTMMFTDAMVNSVAFNAIVVTEESVNDVSLSPAVLIRRIDASTVVRAITLFFVLEEIKVMRVFTTRTNSSTIH